MLNLQELQAKASSLLAEIEAADAKITEAESKGDAETAKAAREVYESRVKEFDDLKAKIEEAKAHMRRKQLEEEIRRLAQPATQVAASVSQSGTLPIPASAKDHAAEAEAHSRAFAKWVAQEELSDKERELLLPKSERVKQVLSGSKVAGARDAVVAPPSLVAGCLGRNYVRAFSSVQDKLRGKTITTLNDPVANPSFGNLLVPPEYRAQLQQLPFDEAPLFESVTIVPSTSGTVTFPGLMQTDANEFGGVSFSWTTEAGQKPSTEPRFQQIEISTYELCGYTEISERALSRSAISLESLLVALFRPAMHYTIDNAILNGTGTGQPLGIIPVAAGCRTVPRQVAGQVTDADLVNLKHAVKPAHRASAVFALSDSVEHSLETAVDNMGRPLFRASTAGGPYDRLAGYPYIVSPNSPAVGNRGDVVFGALRWYFLVMEEEVTVARSEHYQFRNNVIAFKVFVVVGGRPMQPRAFAVLGDVSSS